MLQDEINQKEKCCLQVAARSASRTFCSAKPAGGLRHMHWNSEIQAETTYFALDPGVYEFDVVDIEKGYHGGSEKLPACNKAIVHLKVHYCKGKDVKVQKQLFLHSKTEGFLAAFFISIGLMEKGESLSMNWDAAIGRSGRAEFYNRESATGKSYFEVKRFLPPDDENSSTGGF